MSNTEGSFELERLLFGKATKKYCGDFPYANSYLMALFFEGSTHLDAKVCLEWVLPPVEPHKEGRPLLRVMLLNVSELSFEAGNHQGFQHGSLSREGDRFKLELIESGTELIWHFVCEEIVEEQLIEDFQPPNEYFRLCVEWGECATAGEPQVGP